MGWREFKINPEPDADFIHEAQAWSPEINNLIQWFTENVHRLPVKPYKLCEGEGWSIHYMTPAATYQKILEAIEQGPEGEHAKDGTLYGVLQSLHDKFGGGHHG